jgi:S-methylmethionine-dependent homocysteine/selenocysteine methylase
MTRSHSALSERLAEPKPLLLDGATGTELERRGAATGAPLWSAHALIERPTLVSQIHAEYLAAGAELLTANTFRTQRRTLERAGREESAATLTALATRLARQAVEASALGRQIFVLGSAPPLEDCYRPDLVPDDEALAREHAEHAANLAESGVDAILVETMNTIREAHIAVRAASEVALPVWVSFACDDSARLLSGEKLGDALTAIAPARPDAILVNCLPLSRVGACLPILRQCRLPFGVYANLGEPIKAGRTEAAAPREFAAAAATWRDAGARILGGCCGTTPAHIAAIAAVL